MFSSLIRWFVFFQTLSEVISVSTFNKGQLYMFFLVTQYGEGYDLLDTCFTVIFAALQFPDQWKKHELTWSCPIYDMIVFLWFLLYKSFLS